jgi:hypothetical protein
MDRLEHSANKHLQVQITNWATEWVEVHSERFSHLPITIDVIENAFTPDDKLKICMLDKKTLDILKDALQTHYVALKKRLEKEATEVSMSTARYQQDQQDQQPFLSTPTSVARHFHQFQHQEYQESSPKIVQAQLYDSQQSHNHFVEQNHQHAHEIKNHQGGLLLQIDQQISPSPTFATIQMTQPYRNQSKSVC